MSRSNPEVKGSAYTPLHFPFTVPSEAQKKQTNIIKIHD